MTRIPRIRRFILIGFLGVAASCLLALSAAFLSNLTLPSESSVIERLSDLDKARLAEATHLRKSLGGEVWPGWGEADIPIIFHDYASRERFWRLQFQELKRMTNHRSEIRFYYTGMAQAVLLDWLAPEWKFQAFGEGVLLEHMLQEAVDGS